MSSIEIMGDKFNQTQFLKARELTWSLMQATYAKVEEGMLWQDIETVLNQLAPDYGVEKWWHPTKIRLNQDTLQTFRGTNSDQIGFQKDDLIFFDLGPVILGHEADCGRTFGESEKYQNLKMAAEEIFQMAKQFWTREHPSGVELFRFADDIARSRSLILNPEMKGHRLSDFPHAVFDRRKLSETSDQLKPLGWILEIHILDQNLQRGAFFEDLLM